jgi:hypothetical protein
LNAEHTDSNSDGKEKLIELLRQALAEADLLGLSFVGVKISEAIDHCESDHKA